MNKVIADIMTTSVFQLDAENSMFEVHQLMKESQIRHVPISQNNEFIGVVTQKSIISKVMYLLDNYGSSALERREKSISVNELIDKKIVFANPDMPLVDAAQFFLSNRHGCLPIVSNENKLQGIVTSSDFVKLSLLLLEREN
ncbi:CBS domain-containing protein [Pseudoalteromonas denitrificans]|uniref:CBS domain-containing protein n=1 Tax=Pseudoalteromonas denitrificans DSM 6059 TaxID=1123010 RepID=A0A1I1EU78_9GAMM|nr:CBS domain-containing protein [Pseudoalteromonas denitrificans]SFB90725.1 CBS domain-containing protein [Pseudoalteromonas denitrificans DSM 6059]